MCKSSRGTFGPFHRRTIHPPNDLDLGFLIDWTQFAKHPFYLFCVRGFGEPEIYMRPGLGSDDVGKGPATDHAWIHRKARLTIGKLPHLLNLPRQFRAPRCAHS